MSTTPTRVIELAAMPAVLPAFARAALSATRKVSGPVTIPDWQVRVPGLGFDRLHLASYNELCGFSQADAVPMTYPQVLATPMYLHLMTQPGFPLPLMGLVHVRNVIEQRRELRLDDSFDASVRLGESREVRAGLELDLIVTFTDMGGEVLWLATMTVLKRGRKRETGSSTSAPPPAASGLAQYLTIEAPEHTGRRYARISQDYNPIHLHASSARLFGFKRAIAHGLWSKARVLAELGPKLASGSRLFEVQFKRPLSLPGRATLRYEQAPARIGFSLLEPATGRVHVTGSLR